MNRFRPKELRSARSMARIPCQVVRERDFRLVADRIVNLSATGVLVAPADPVLTGETVVLSFPGAGGRFIDAEAIVTRVLHGRRLGEHTRALGLNFERMDAASRRALIATLRRCLPVPPGARRERRSVPR